MKQPHIRVGVRGWNGAEPAGPFDSSATRNILWVEIGGKRIDEGVVSVRGKYGQKFHSTTIEVVGVPEFFIVEPEDAGSFEPDPFQLPPPMDDLNR